MMKVKYPIILFFIVLCGHYIIGCATTGAFSHGDKGIDYLNEGEYDLAIAEFTKAIQLSPYYKFYRDRAYAYLKKGDYENAVIDCNIALTGNPNDPLIYDYRARAYHNLGNNGQACLDFKTACELGNCENYNFMKKEVEICE